MIDQKCRLCPRECKAERENGQMGFCGMTGKGIRAARAALHFWEEPCISGKGGSGAVFFAGCTLRCVYCQNREIAAGRMGEEISLSRLVDIFFELKEQGKCSAIFACQRLSKGCKGGTCRDDASAAADDIR